MDRKKYEAPKIIKIHKLEAISLEAKSNRMKEEREAIEAGKKIKERSGIKATADVEKPSKKDKYILRERYGGHEYERDLLYGVDITNEKYLLDYLAIFFAWQKRNGYSEEQAKTIAEKDIQKKGLIYLSQIEAIKLVKKNQPWPDPTNPDKSIFGNLLRSAIIEELDVAESKMGKVKFYTATSREKKPNQAYSDEREKAADHTPLDWYHGIDCFIEIGGDENSVGTIIPMDASLDRKKVNDKAIIIPEIDIPNPDEEIDDFMDNVYEIAKEVIKMIPEEAVKDLTGS